MLKRRRHRWTPLTSAPLSLRQMAAFGLDFPRRDRGFWFGLAIDVIWPMLVLFTRFRVRGLPHVPRTGGVLIATNHLSFADPTTITSFCLKAGRMPRYLAKSGLWELPVIGSVMRSGKHIPVYRDSRTAGGSYRDAVAAVRDGACVVIFPEATFSDNPDGWPMRGKSGCARIALATGAPVIPVANWGTHRLLPAKAKFPRLWPAKTVDLVAGPPVDLSDLLTDRPRRSELEQATERIMESITTLLGEARGEEPPKA